MIPWGKSILLHGFQKQIVVPRGVALQFLLQKHENIRNDLQFILHDVDRIVGKYLQLDAKLSEFARSQVYLVPRDRYSSNLLRPKAYSVPVRSHGPKSMHYWGVAAVTYYDVFH